MAWRINLVDYNELRSMLAGLLTPGEEVVRHGRISSSLTWLFEKFKMKVAGQSMIVNAHIKPANHVCQRCGGEVVCVFFHTDSGTGGWMDDKDEYNYHHICEKCVHANSTWQSYTVDLHPEGTYVPCPYCENVENLMLCGTPQWGNVRYYVNDEI